MNSPANGPGRKEGSKLEGQTPGRRTTKAEWPWGETERGLESNKEEAGGKDTLVWNNAGFESNSAPKAHCDLRRFT